MERIIPQRAAGKLERRRILRIDPGKAIAVKRDVHEFRVEASADRFAAAFRLAMKDPAATFGLIRVKRPANRLGAEFEVGERFQGCYSIEAALLRRLSGCRLRGAVARFLEGWPLRRLIAWAEDALLSDYAVIERLVLKPDRKRGQTYLLHYRYLAGTPLAGSSTFCIEPAGRRRCLVRQIFEYQEINGLALIAFQCFGLKMHDQVVHRQILAAALGCGAPPPVGTIPSAYTEA